MSTLLGDLRNTKEGRRDKSVNMRIDDSIAIRGLSQRYSHVVAAPKQLVKVTNERLVKEIYRGQRRALHPLQRTEYSFIHCIEHGPIIQPIMLCPTHFNGVPALYSSATPGLDEFSRFKKPMPWSRLGALPLMIAPEHPITFFAELPPRPGVILERDDVPIFRQLFPVRRQRSRLHHKPPSVASYITAVARRRLGENNNLVDKHRITRAVPSEVQNQLPPSLLRRASRLDPGETRSTKPKHFQGVCHPAHPHTPVVSAERVTPTASSHDPPIASKEKSPASMAVGDSNAATQSTASESGLTRVDPLATDTMCSPAAILLPAPTHPAQQPHTPAAVSSSSPPAVNPITPQLLLNHPDSSTPIPASAATAAVACHTEQPSWPLKRTEKAIRKQKEYVTFYRSFSGGPLDSPPDVPEAYEHPWRIADLYVHHNQTQNTFQVWMRSETRWIKAAVDTHHPTLSNYRLKLLDNGEPSWVLRKTMVTDRGRAKRKQEAFTTSKLADI